MCICVCVYVYVYINYAIVANEGLCGIFAHTYVYMCICVCVYVYAYINYAIVAKAVLYTHTKKFSTHTRSLSKECVGVYV